MIYPERDRNGAEGRGAPLPYNAQINKKNRGRYVLGISAFYHDSAACLLEDGEISGAVQEERFSRKKGDSAFPVQSIDYCLRHAEISLSEISDVIFYENPKVKFDRLWDSYKSFWPDSKPLFKKSFPVWMDRRLILKKEIQRELGSDFGGTISFTDHHLSHAASAFFPSPFAEATILTLDAVGEWSTSSIGVGEGNRIHILKEMKFPHSVGMLYSAFTYYTGFKVNSGEYKLMGLAPYGMPVYEDLIRTKLVKVFDDGSIRLDMSYFSFQNGMEMTSDKFHDLFGGKPRKVDEQITQREMDLAASIQKVTEDIVMKAAFHAHRLTGKKNLVMAGGVALNCVSNGRLRREGPFENVWVQPASGDSGGALGAALLMWYHRLDNERIASGVDHQQGSYLGPSFTLPEIQAFLDSAGARYTRIDDENELLDLISDQLNSEAVIGWFQGRMEFGPRALGARSIIGDPRSEKMQQIMNLKIKFRESFRPFAPCVLKEHAHKYFEMEPEEESPYMLFVSPVRENQRRELSEQEVRQMLDADLRKRVSVPRSTIPAITHVDYSARVQTVTEERNGRLYRLMQRFYEKTSCPVIVNTSFNIRGEPIVCSPEQAYTCFMATDMDCLVIENFVLIKENQNPALMPELVKYKQSFQLD